MVFGTTIIIIMLISVLIIQLFWPRICHTHKLVSYFLIPTILLGLWFSLIVYQSYQIENVFSLLTTEYPRKELFSYPKGEIYQGQKIMGNFTATNNYLGILGFRFWTFYRLNSDYLIFRIKPTGSTQWYYENRYLSDQFQPNQYFTFGFPSIQDSANKEYSFEIESSAGMASDAVGVSDIDPVFVTKFKYPKEMIMSSPKNIITFVFAKFLNLMSKAEFKASSYIYLLPFAIYLLTFSSQYAITAGKTRFVLLRVVSAVFKLISRSQVQISFMLVTTGIVLDIMFVSRGDVTLILLAFLIWQVSKHFVSQGQLFMLLSFALLIFSGITYYLNVPQISERSAAWVWLFLVLFVINSLLSCKRSNL